MRAGVRFAPYSRIPMPETTASTPQATNGHHHHELNGIDYDDDSLIRSTPDTDDEDEGDEADDEDSRGESGLLDASYSSWNQSSSTITPRGSIYPTTDTVDRRSPDIPVSPPARPHRPAAPLRTPSSTYAPIRTPAPLLYPQINNNNRPIKIPTSTFRAQEDLYVQRLRQGVERDYFSSAMNLSSLYQEGSELEDESPSADAQYDHPENLAREDAPGEYPEPSEEDLLIPANLERLEWHSMLARVLMGDVVKQEKKRLIGSTEEKSDSATVRSDFLKKVIGSDDEKYENVLVRPELFVGIRARVCGRSLAEQRRMIDDGRSKSDALIDEVVHFEIQGKDKTLKTPREQVQDILARWEQCEQLWPTQMAMVEAKKGGDSTTFKPNWEAFNTSWEALVAWNNITELINTELKILQNWVGNEDLDFQRTTIDASNEAAGIEREESFLDRIVKDDNLRSLTGGDSNMLMGLSAVIYKAKSTLIEYAEAFEKRHLPPYIEELLVLIGFPTRLIEEVIGMRLQYASKMREPVSMMTDQLMLQFRSVLELAVKIKQEYTDIAEPENGWDPPPCMDENFDQVALAGLKYYFKLIGWRISSNKNTFKEAEILETEWEFSNNIGRYIEGGDIEVAEHFRFVKSTPQNKGFY